MNFQERRDTPPLRMPRPMPPAGELTLRLLRSERSIELGSILRSLLSLGENMFLRTWEMVRPVVCMNLLRRKKRGRRKRVPQR